MPDAQVGGRSLASRVGIAAVVVGLLVAGWLFFRSPEFGDEALPPYQAPPGVGSVDPAEFIGSSACAPCHANQYARWATSTHGRAGGTPAPETVLAPFDGTPIRFLDAEVIPLRTAAGNYAFIVDWSGGVDTMSVDGVVGGGHMVGGGTQGFFTLHLDGTQRFVPFDWSRTAAAWFCNTRFPNPGEWRRITEDLPLAACADWPPRRRLGQVGQMANCDTCHGSQIRANFDPESGRTDTEFTGLDINCESCHGPGQRHVELVQAGAALRSPDLGLSRLATLSEDGSLETCFRCHATRLVLHEGDLAGEPLEANASLLLPLLTDRPFLPDNRTATFAYQLNHLGSGCYLDGSMTCVSCHEPHGQGYQDEFAGGLPSRFDDGQCLGCHASKSAGPEAHTFHETDSEGSRCVSCHMPYLQHRSIGDDVPYARSDHTIPVPRPGVDERLGVTSACGLCHSDQTPDALAAQVEQWYGPLKPWRPLVQGNADAPGVTDPALAARLLLRPEDSFPMAQASGLSQFLLRFVRPDEGPTDPDVRARLEALAGDMDVDVQALAVATLHLGWGQEPEVMSLLVEQVARKGERQGLLRDRWSAALRYVGDAYRLRGAPAYAEVAYTRSLVARPNEPLAQEGLGLAHLALGHPDQAEAAFRSSFRSDSTRSSALLNTAIAVAQQGRPEEQNTLLLDAARRFPFDPRAHFALGNAYLSGRDVLRAGDAFERAVELDPGLAAPRLGLAQVLAARGLPDAARTQVLLALEFEPSNDQARQLLQFLDRP